MYEFKIPKSANEIEDICVAYGVCKILNDNDIEFRLKDNKSIYSIYTEEFDIEDLEYYELDENNKYWNINSSTNFKEYTQKIPKVNQYLEENLHSIFKSLCGIEVFKSKSSSCSSIGNNYYTKSIKATTSPKATSQDDLIHNLSVVGWIYGCSYIKNKAIEITLIMKPNDTDEIKKPYNLSYVDKETGEIKILTYTPNSSESEMTARLYCETMVNYNLLKEEYNEIIVMYSMLGGNKPLSHKTFSLKTYDNLTINFYNDMLKPITWSSVNYDVKAATSEYIINIEKYSYFSKLIRVYGKNNQLINIKFKEEILEMYNEIVKSIYNDEIVIKLGNGLNRLLYEKKGFNAQIKLYSVLNERHLQNTIMTLIDEYKRVFGFNLLNDEELNRIINKINNKQEAKICADAIIAYSKVFFTPKNNQ